MPRRLRIEYPGAVYHVMNRGDRREDIFKDDDYGVERHETGEVNAQPLVRQGLQVLGWEKKELSHFRKGDKGKVKLGRRLRAETTMTLRWIADRLRMGSWTYVSNLLREK